MHRLKLDSFLVFVFLALCFSSYHPTWVVDMVKNRQRMVRMVTDLTRSVDTTDKLRNSEMQAQLLGGRSYSCKASCYDEPRDFLRFELFLQAQHLLTLLYQVQIAQS